MTKTFFLNITLGNESLSDSGEVKRLLRKAADNLTDEDLNHPHAISLRDINGNTVGSYGLQQVKEEFTYQGLF